VSDTANNGFALCKISTKYNIHQHLQAQHVDWEKNVVDGPELQAFHKQIMVSDDKEKRLGNPGYRHGFHSVAQNDSTDVRLPLQPIQLFTPLNTYLAYLPSAPPEHMDVS